ncbi:tyrosine-protein phosphatase [Rudaea sp.]|uniref:phosphatase domain-containing protein n=1 Tax=Rudaea sp. TaxID=2136325 RepID=UPI00321FAE7A
MRPAHWAQPLTGAGVENLYHLSDTLYRSAQPRSSDVPALVGLGIRTVVSLRAFNGDERRFADSGIALVRFRINTWDIDDAEVARALATMVAAQRLGPVLVHCWHGADRTGVVCAAYRMVVEGWDKADARAEMFDGGFGYHAVWRNIPAYIDRFDIEAMRRRVAEI